MSTAIYNTPDDCLAPGDVRAFKRLAGLADLASGVELQSADWTVAGTPLPGTPLSPLAPFNPVLNDATVSALPGTGLRLNPAPQPFVQTVDQAGNLNIPAVNLGTGFFDHVKYLVFAPRQPTPTPVGYPAPADGRELIAAYRVSGAQTYATPTKFPAAFVADIPNLSRDPRLAVPAVCVYDPVSFTYVDTFLTNDTLYAVYGVRPFNKPSFGGPGPDYMAFDAVVPLARRNVASPLGDFVDVQMAYNRQQGYLRWVVDGEELYRVTKIGYPLESQYMVRSYGGPPTEFAPAMLRMGFGLYSTLEWTRPLDPGVDDGAPSNHALVATQAVATYLDPVNVVAGNGATAGDPLPFTNASFDDPASLLANRIFGQGAQAIIQAWQAVVL